MPAIILLAFTLVFVPACQKKAPGPTEIGIDAAHEATGLSVFSQPFDAAVLKSQRDASWPSGVSESVLARRGSDAVYRCLKDHLDDPVFARGIGRVRVSINKMKAKVTLINYGGGVIEPGSPAIEKCIGDTFAVSTIEGLTPKDSLEMTFPFRARHWAGSGDAPPP